MKIIQSNGSPCSTYAPGVAVKPLVTSQDGAVMGLSQVSVTAGAWLTAEEGEAHPQSETIMVLSGSLQVEQHGYWEAARGGMVVHVSSNERHRIRAGEDGAELLIVACPDWHLDIEQARRML